nr:MAG TPA: hypothetical protein [Caudoviricetes sp.]
MIDILLIKYSLIKYYILKCLIIPSYKRESQPTNAGRPSLQ